MLAATACLIFAPVANAENATSTKSLFNQSWRGGTNQTGNASRLESLQQQYQRLLAMLEQLRGKINQTATSTAESAANIDCARRAASTRETAVSTAYSTLTACNIAAFNARKTAVDAAWSYTSRQERNNAITNAWNIFKNSAKICQTTYRQTIQTAWGDFKTKIKTCGANNLEGMHEGYDLSIEN